MHVHVGAAAQADAPATFLSDYYMYYAWYLFQDTPLTTSSKSDRNAEVSSAWASIVEEENRRDAVIIVIMAAGAAATDGTLILWSFSLCPRGEINVDCVRGKPCLAKIK